MGIEGKVAIVTGAARGVGEAIAVRLTADGAHLAVVDLNRPDDTAKRIIDAGGEAAGYTCDVADRAQVFDTVAKVEKELGPVAILANNAGLHANLVIDRADRVRRRRHVRADGAVMATAPACPFAPQTLEGVRSAPAAFAELREQGVVRSTAHGGFHVLSRHADVLAALRDPDTFISGEGTRRPQVRESRILPLDSDPPVRTAYRSLFTEWVTRHIVRGMIEGLRGLVDQLIRDFHANGGGDRVQDVALPLPLAMLTEVVGFSRETVSEFHQKSRRAKDLFSEEDILEAHAGILDLVRAEIRRHRELGDGGFINWLLAKQIDGRTIRDGQAERVLMTLAVAGHETTTSASSAMATHLAEDRTLQHLRSQPERIPILVEEEPRLSTAIFTIARSTVRHVEMGGLTIPAGSRVLLAYGGANRDGAHFANRDAFDVDPGAAGHLALSFGRHACADALPARTELPLVLESLTSFPEIGLAGEPEYGTLGGGALPETKYLPFRCKN